MPIRSRRGKYTAKRASAARTIQAAARKRAFTKARGGLKKVARIQRQPYVPKQIKNTASIATLSRAVNRLQKSQLGQYQKQCQQLSFFPNGVGSGFSRTRPMCFMANQFCNPVPTGGAATNYPDIFGLNSDQANPVVEHRARWSIWQNNFGEQGIPDRFNSWAGANDDEVSQHIYQPLSAYYAFNFKMDMTPSQPPNWIRIDFLKPKKVLRSSTTHDLNLPEGLPQFNYIAEDSMQIRNAINYTYWTPVRKTKWIKFHIPNSTATATQPVERVVKFGFKFGKVMHPDIDEAATDGSKFYLNIPTKDQVWVVISTSHTNPYNGLIMANRKIAWRDQHGSAT